jgi:hypothetical protein
MVAARRGSGEFAADSGNRQHECTIARQYNLTETSSPA